MDIRDIKETILVPENPLESMFKLQLELLDKYIGFEEGLPPYPVDLNSRESQVLLKDFTGRIIEELGEGYESYRIMLDMFHRGEDRPDMIPHLQNFNEEISDAIHFWLELMIYSGYTVETMENWLKEEFDLRSLATGHIYNGLKDWYSLATFLVDQETQFAKFPSFIVIPEEAADAFLMGGRRLSNDLNRWTKEFLWDITYHFQIARNTLKNKPWKQTEMLTDEVAYEKHMKQGTISLFKFMYFVGLKPNSIYEIYYKKNMVNKFRIESNY